MDKSGGKLYQHKFDEVGEVYAAYATRSDLPDLDDFIQTQGESKLSLMMMAAMVKRLRSINTELSFMRDYLMKSKINDVEKRDDPADGMLMVLRVTGADVPLVLCDQSGLSVRARKALRKGKFQSLAEITDGAILNLRNCGISTVRELEDWKRLQYERIAGSNGTKSGSLDTGEKR